MFCPKCGNQLPDGAMFCSSCGSSVNIQPVAPAEPVAPMVATPVFTPAEPVAPMAESPAFTPVEPVAPMTVAPAFTPAEPVAPMTVAPAFTPAEPVAPIATAPAFTPDEPVAPMTAAPAFTPDEPVAPMAAAPTFTPDEPVAPMTVAPAFTPTEPNAPVSNGTAIPKKKSKAPLFIGLGIGLLLIAIAVIVIVLVLGDDEKDNKPASATEQSTTLKAEKETTSKKEEETTSKKEEETTSKKEEETTSKKEEESTTPKQEETTTDNSNENEIVAATNVATDLMSTLKNSDYTSFGNFLMPGMAEYLKDNNLTVDGYASLFALCFYDGTLTNFLEYNIKAAEECDDSFYVEEAVEEYLKSYPEYKQPTAFARAEVELSYKDQKSSIDLHFAYVDDKYYFYSIDDSNFDIDFDLEDETESGTGEDTTKPSEPEITEDDVKQMLSSNNKTLTSSNITGKNYQGEGFELTIPADWAQSGSSIVSFTAPSGITNFNITYVNETLLSIYSTKELLKLYCDTYKDMSATDISVGSLQAPNANGYYITYKLYTFTGVQYLFPSADKKQMYIFTITTMDTNSEEYKAAESAIASFKLK